MNNLLVIVFIFLFVIVITMFFLMRREAVKAFLKQFVLLDDLNDNLDDSLDNILDYEMVLELLKREVTKSERYNFPVSLMLIDIGTDDSVHRKADFLEKVQNTVKRSIRETDVFGFLDSDNRFICLLPHTKFDAAYDLAERLRLKLSRRLSLGNDADVHLLELDLDRTEFDLSQDSVPVACGVSELEQFEDLDSLLARAKEALESAKISGSHCTMPKPIIKDVIISDVPKHLN